jgi:hypothetical protein
MVRILDGSNEIVRVRLADSAAQAVTATPEVEETWPSWSAPAGRLAYLASTGSGRHDLVLWIRNEGRGQLRAPLRDEQWHVWSPGGRRSSSRFAAGSRLPGSRSPTWRGGRGG